MPEFPNDTLLLGSPRFADPRVAELARTLGTEAAWQDALGGSNPTQVVLALAGIDGSFAVALREPSGRAILAVDRFAVYSLVYRVAGDRLEFATRADELADTGGIDPQAIFDYLYFHVIPSPRTIFSGVYRLPPGHFALFENGRLTVAPYWNAVFTDEGPAPSFDTLRDEFKTLLQSAVADQLDGSKPACFLSGGTDSSTIAGMLGRASGRRAATYSIGFEAEGYDEMSYARLAAKHFETEHHEYYVTPDDLVRSIPAVAAHYDQPFGNSSALPAFYCAKVAQSDGVSKILAGDGGDELFGGNTRYARQRVFGWYDAIPGALRRGVMEPVFESTLVARTPLLKKASSYIEQAKVPMPDRLDMYNLLLRLGTGAVLTAAFLARIDTQSPSRQQREVWTSSQTSSLLNRNLAYDWRYTLAECDLPKVFATTRLAGVAVGFPFLDQRLLDFSLRLPADYKLKGLKLRWFFKEALRGFLPDEILVKKKQGFGLPFGVWASKHEGLRQLATESLASLAERNVVRADFIQSLLTERLPEHPGYYGEMVWILLMLEQWMRRHAPDFRLA